MSYLSTEKATQSIARQITTVLRSNPRTLEAPTKLYSIVLHLFTPRAPCGPCEFVLNGFQHCTEDTLSFPKLLQTQLLILDETFRFPHEGVRFTIDISYSEGFAPHKNLPPSMHVPNALREKIELGRIAPERGLKVNKFSKPVEKKDKTALQEYTVFASEAVQHQLRHHLPLFETPVVELNPLSFSQLLFLLYDEFLGCFRRRRTLHRLHQVHSSLSDASDSRSSEANAYRLALAMYWMRRLFTSLPY